MADPSKGKKKNAAKSFGRYIDLGLQFFISIALGVVLGWYLDSKLKTLPLFLVLGILLGATSGFLNIYRVVYPQKKRGKTKDTDSYEQ
ncbi:MAG: hypothetical protein GWP06_16895 [Actinobacteria bacterium]|nr:hypothetical protein [Actinomycetota bacterium]